MAKGRRASSKEIRKPKAKKKEKHNASQPSQKTGVVSGLEHLKK